MPLSSTDKYFVRKYLGYPQVYKQANPRLESAIEVVDLDPDAVADIQNILAQLAIIQTYINTKDIKVGGLKSVDDKEVEWYDDASHNGPLKAHFKQGNFLCAQLSNIVGVPIENIIFGTRGYTSDNWKQFSGTSNPDGGRASFNFGLGFK